MRHSRWLFLFLGVVNGPISVCTAALLSSQKGDVPCGVLFKPEKGSMKTDTPAFDVLQVGSHCFNVSLF